MRGAKHSTRVYIAVGTVIALCATGFFVFCAIRNIKDVPAVNWEAASLAVAAVSVTLVVLTIGISGWIWACLLRDNGVFVPWKKTQSIFAVAQFGKYLPGNVGQYVGRVFLAREAGIPVLVTAGTMLMEFLWITGVAAGLGLVAVLLFVDASSFGWYLNVGPFEIVLLVSFAVIMPWVGIRLINAYLPGIARRLSVGERIPEPRLRTALLVAALFGVCFVIMGLILKLQAQWLFDVTDGSLLELTCLFAVAWITGFLTPGVPGGLGVREAMMLLLLSPVVGSGAAVGLGVTLRITTTLGDAVAFLVGIVWRHRLSKSSPLKEAHNDNCN